MSALERARAGIRLVVPPSDMRTFILLTPGRSGSTLLLSLLESHPDIEIPRFELFHPGAVSTAVDQVRTRRPALVVRKAAAVAAARGGKAFGFSMHPQHFKMQAITDGPEWCRRRHGEGARFITLIRRDSVASGISALIALEAGQWHRTAGDDAPPPVRIDPAAVVEQATRMDDAADELERLVGDLSHLPLMYEDALADASVHQATADRIFEHLGLSSHSVSTALRRPDRPLAERIANYDEVVTVLRAANRSIPD